MRPARPSAYFSEMGEDFEQELEDLKASVIQ